MQITRRSAGRSQQFRCLKAVLAAAFSGGQRAAVPLSPAREYGACRAPQLPVGSSRNALALGARQADV